MKIALIKQLNGTFKPAYDSDYEKTKRIKAGDLVEVDIKKPRNYEFHKKFFALINLVYENQEIYHNVEDLREDLIIASGFYVDRTALGGELVRRAKSVSFASMDELEFSDLYNKVVDTIVKHFHFDKQDLADNVAQYF